MAKEGVLLAELRCSNCNKLLFMHKILKGEIEIKCTRCKGLNRFTTLRYISVEKEQRE